MSIQLRVGGVWAATIGAVGSLRWTTTAKGGLDTVTWRMSLPDTFDHQALRMGSLVELFAGPAPLGPAVLNEPNHTKDGWDFSAVGIFDDLYTAYLCLDSGGNTTSIPDVAIDQAIADGFPVTRPTSLSSVAFAEADETDFLNNIGDLLDAWAESEGKRWRVNPDATITAAVDPTTPDWHLVPGAARIGLDSEDYASVLGLRFRDSASTFATVVIEDTSASGKRRKAVPVDLTGLGVITSGKATDIGEGMLAQGKARYAFSNAVSPSRFQLVTPGGTPAFLPSVRGGQLVRMFGVIDPQNPNNPHFDWVIGRTDYEAGAKAIELSPVELAARNLPDILTAVA